MRPRRAGAKLAVLATARTRVDEGIVERLEDALAAARRGELASLVMVANVRGSQRYRTWSAGADNALEVVGALFAEAQAIARRLSGD